MFTNRQSTVIRSVPDEYEYHLYISTKKECNSIGLGLSSTTDEIVAFGDSASMDEATADNVLPPPTFQHNLLTTKVENSYPCWCCEKLGVDQFISHKTSLNSWECLMETLGRPEYVVIVKRKLNAEQE